MKEYILSAEQDLCSLPVSKDAIIAHLKIDTSTEDAQFDYYSILIKSIEKTIENITKRTLTTKTFILLTEYDNIDINYKYNYSICSYSLFLEKAPLQSVASVQFLDEDNIWQTIASTNYYVTQSSSFSTLFFTDTSEITNIANKKQNIKVTFDCGYGEDYKSIPYDLQQAILLILASLEQYRGDCIDSKSLEPFDIMSNIPPQAQLIINTYKIIEMYI